MPPPKSIFSSVYLKAAFALLGVAFSVLLWWGARAKIVRGWNDFVAFYAGATLAGTPDLYNQERFVEVERRSAGAGGEALQFIRPPYYALLLSPLGRLPYRAAYAVWQSLSILAVAAFAYLWPYKSRWPAVWACAWSLSLAECFAQGQDCAFLLVWIVLALRFHKSRPFLAGLFLSLCAPKFHLFLLVPVLIVSQRRWRLGAGLLAGAGAMLLLSFMTGGLDWPAHYLAMLRSPKVSPAPFNMPNLHGLLTGLPHAMFLEIFASALVAAAVALASRRGAFGPALAATLIGGLLVSYHAYPADGVLLIPALLLILFETRWTVLRVTAYSFLTPVACFGLVQGGALMVLLRLALVFLAVALAFENWRRSQGAADGVSGAASQAG